MSTDIYTCAYCEKTHLKFAVARKRNDFKTNPKPFCSKECAVAYLKAHAWKSYRLDCKDTDAITWIIAKMNDPDYRPIASAPIPHKQIDISEDVGIDPDKN